MKIIGIDAKTSSGMRNIPMTTEARNALRAQMQINKQVFGETNDNSAIFRTIGGDLIGHKAINEELSLLCKKAGIDDKITSHALRATFATRAIESGMNPKTLQEILGHSDINITMNLYAHVMESTKAKEMSKLTIRT